MDDIIPERDQDDLAIQHNTQIHNEDLTSVDIKSYAWILHDQLIYNIVLARVDQNVNDAPIFSKVYHEFLAFLSSCNFNKETISEILNYKLYNWFFGNCISDFISTIFVPSNVIHVDLAVSQIYSRDNRFLYALKPEQVHDAYKTLFRIIHFFGVKANVIDYYGEPYHEQLLHLTKLSVQFSMPEHIKNAIPAFYLLLKHGDRLILMQEAIMMRFILRNRKKKRVAAYNKIADWWFEIVSSPYTAPGQRLLAARTAAFEAKTKSQKALKDKPFYIK